MGYFFAMIEKKGSGSQMTYDFEISEVTTKKLTFIFFISQLHFKCDSALFKWWNLWICVR